MHGCVALLVHKPSDGDLFCFIFDYYVNTTMFMFSFLLGKCLKEEYLDPMVNICLHSKGDTILYFRVVVPFYIPVMFENLSCFSSLSALGIVTLLAILVWI